jgi:hypothetical protein
MRPVSDLAKLYDSFGYRLLRLRKTYSAATAVGEPWRSELLSYAVIELDNLMLGTLRVLTISSLRSARTAQGHRIRVIRNFGHEEEISAFMLSVLSAVKFRRLNSPTRINKKEEPTVRDPRDTEKVLLAAGATNITSFQNALALNTAIFLDLGTARNFYAHRNKDTWRKIQSKAQAMGIFSSTHGNDVITTGLPGRPVSLFEDWLDDAELFFEEATK